MPTNGWQDPLGQEGEGTSSETSSVLCQLLPSALPYPRSPQAQSHSALRVFPCLQGISAQMELLYHRPISSPLLNILSHKAALLKDLNATENCKTKVCSFVCFWESVQIPFCIESGPFAACSAPTPYAGAARWLHLLPQARADPDKKLSSGTTVFSPSWEIFSQ